MKLIGIEIAFYCCSPSHHIEAIHLRILGQFLAPRMAFILLVELLLGMYIYGR